MRNLIIPWYYYLNNKINNNSSMLYVFCLLLQVQSPPFPVILLGIWSYLDRQICPDYSWASLTSSFLLGLANGEHWQEIGVRGIYFPAPSRVWGLPWMAVSFYSRPQEVLSTHIWEMAAFQAWGWSKLLPFQPWGAAPRFVVSLLNCLHPCRQSLLKSVCFLLSS